MVDISASIVKELRDKTGAGMMDCKKALLECGASVDNATDWLRKKGLASAGKKTGRIASEGVVSIAVDGNKAVIIELNAETDFVAKNEKFQALARSLLSIALKNNVTDLDSLLTTKFSDNSDKTVQEEIMGHIATIGENISLRRLEVLSIASGVIGSYVHNAVSDSMGKIGVLVSLESDVSNEIMKSLAKQISMHIAAAKPESLSVEQLDQNIIEREKAIFSEQAIASGKPESVVEKMVEGRIRKFCEEVVLLEQSYAIDGKTKISQMISDAAKQVGADITVTGFVRYALGEGIEKQESNFAAEVVSMVQPSS